MKKWNEIKNELDNRLSLWDYTKNYFSPVSSCIIATYCMTKEDRGVQIAGAFVAIGILWKFYTGYSNLKKQKKLSKEIEELEGQLEEKVDNK